MAARKEFAINVCCVESCDEAHVHAFLCYVVVGECSRLKFMTLVCNFHSKRQEEEKKACEHRQRDTLAYNSNVNELFFSFLLEISFLFGIQLTISMQTMHF